MRQQSLFTHDPPKQVTEHEGKPCIVCTHACRRPFMAVYVCEGKQYAVCSAPCLSNLMIRIEGGVL